VGNSLFSFHFIKVNQQEALYLQIYLQLLAGSRSGSNEIMCSG
jgi:hypothetical protein